MNGMLPILVVVAILLALVWKVPMLTFMLLLGLVWWSDTKDSESATKGLEWGMFAVGAVGVARLTHFVFSGIPLL